LCEETQVGDQHLQHDTIQFTTNFKKIGRHHIVRKVSPAQ